MFFFYKASATQTMLILSDAIYKIRDISIKYRNIIASLLSHPFTHLVYSRLFKTGNLRLADTYLLGYLHLRAPVVISAHYYLTLSAHKPA